MVAKRHQLCAQPCYLHVRRSNRGSLSEVVVTETLSFSHTEDFAVQHLCFGVLQSTTDKTTPSAVT
jgi:hypothetical protein